MEAEKLSDTSAWVLLANDAFEFPLGSIQLSSQDADLHFKHVCMNMRGLVENGGIFEHSTPKGVTTLIHIMPGTMLKVVPGPSFKKFVADQRQAHIAQQMGIVPQNSRRQ